MNAVDMLTPALEAYDAGVCVVRVRTDGQKRPLGKWKRYQTERPDRATVEQWFEKGHPGVGYICGEVSGHLELLEFEGRFRTDENMAILKARLEEARLGSLFNRLLRGYSVWSPRDGLHILYRHEGETLGNTKLARRLANAEELAENPDEKIQTLIETRGEGGFVVAAPSHGTVHPNGKPYTVKSGSPATLATITAAERAALFAVMRTFDENPPPPEPPEPTSDRRTTAKKWAGGSVGDSWFDAVVDHVNATETVRGVLERHGWSHQYDDSKGRALLCRPGKSAGVSGSINGTGRFVNFSSSVPFEAYGQTNTRPTSYDALDIIAMYEHRGDRTDAARHIAEQTGIMAQWKADQPVDGRVDPPTPPPNVDPDTDEDEEDGDTEQSDADTPPSEPERFRRWSMSELLAADLTFEWDVVGMLVRPTYGIDTGELKTLKSYFGTARAIGLAAGVPIFGHWDVPERRRVLFYVAEGGRIPFTRRLIRLAEAHGVDPSNLEGWLEPIFDAGPLDSTTFRESLRHHLETFKPAFVHLDPLYAFQSMQVDAHRVDQQGRMLSEVQNICAEHDATLWITAHMNQTGAGFDLKRISGAGTGEWGDSWVLLKHRETPDVGNGRFRLAVDIGSRQWGGASYELDLDIGRFDADNGSHDGAISFRVRRGGEDHDNVDREAQKRSKARKAVFDTISKARRPLTRTEIRERSTGSPNAYLNAEILALIDQGSLREEGERKPKNGGRTSPLYVWADPWSEGERSSQRAQNEVPAPGRSIDPKQVPSFDDLISEKEPGQTAQIDRPGTNADRPGTNAETIVPTVPESRSAPDGTNAEPGEQ